MSSVMRLGITGPHSSGKTTLLDALRSAPELSVIDFLPEVTRVIKDQGFEINEGGTMDTQILIMATHMQNLLTHKWSIVDRTLIDGLCYTRFLYNENKNRPPKERIQDWFLDYCEDLTETYLPMYTKIFYLPPEIPVKDDGVRSVNEHFHESIVEQFDVNIERFSKMYPGVIVTVRGSVEQRVQTVLEEIRKANKR